MPLTRDASSPIRHDFGVGIRFRMLDGTKEVYLVVSSEALRDRAAEDNRDQSDLEARFRDYRNEIESIAAEKHNRGEAFIVIKSADLAGR